MSAVTVELLHRPAVHGGRASRRPVPDAARAVPDAARLPLRLTPRGRAVVVALACALGIAGVLGAQSATAGSAAPAVPVVTHTVAAGETLWAIASGLAAPGEDVRDVVADLVELNGLRGAHLDAGQQILLPAAG